MNIFEPVRTKEVQIIDASRLSARFLLHSLVVPNVDKHQMGKPSATRHLVVHNQHTAHSSHWSSFSGVDSVSQTHAWDNVDESQLFTDMDAVDLNILK